MSSTINKALLESNHAGIVLHIPDNVCTVAMSMSSSTIGKYDGSTPSNHLRILNSSGDGGVGGVGGLKPARYLKINFMESPNLISGL